MSKLYLSFVLSLLSFLNSHAQKLNVESFDAKPNDITARTQPRQDINGNDCALVKVQLAAPNAVFEGNVIGDVTYNTSEYLVYMAQGSKRLTVKLEGYLPLEVNFLDYAIKSLEPKIVYQLTISGVVNGKQPEPVRAKTGWIVLDSDPLGASVYINNEYVGTTPLNNYKQAYGKYSYRLEHPNYHSSSGTIDLNTNRFEDKIIMNPAFGSVNVKSNVEGAEVLLDGKDTGQKTPCVLAEVASGRHIIALRLNKYAPQQQEITVNDGENVQLNVSLDARFASITINSIEGALIFSNGNFIGASRCTENMMEGYYDIVVRMDHHRSSSKQIQVIAGQSQEITINPIPIYGSLDIASTPRNAIVTVDGKEYGKSPLTIDQLLEGEHVVSLSMEGYNGKKKIVTIRENENSVIDVALNKKDNEINNVRDTLGNTTEKAQALFKEGNEYYKRRDYKEAIRLYRDAADLGNAYAMNNIGTMYEHGEGVSKSHLEAVKWYKKAAELGDSLAMNNLGIMYVHGVGVSHNYTEALKWFKKAAELGCVPAFYNIGVLYANGNGVKRDISEALKWLKEAHRLGYKDSERIIADLESEQRRNVLNRNRFSTPTLNRNSQSVPYYNRNRSSQNNRYRIR